MKTYSIQFLTNRRGRLTLIPLEIVNIVYHHVSRTLDTGLDTILRATIFQMIRFHLVHLLLIGSVVHSANGQDSGEFLQLRWQMPVYSDSIEYDEQRKVLTLQGGRYPIRSLDQFQIWEGYFVRHNSQYYKRTWEGPDQYLLLGEILRHPKGSLRAQIDQRGRPSCKRIEPQES